MLQEQDNESDIVQQPPFVRNKNVTILYLHLKHFIAQWKFTQWKDVFYLYSIAAIDNMLFWNEQLFVELFLRLERHLAVGKLIENNRYSHLNMRNNFIVQSSFIDVI